MFRGMASIAKNFLGDSSDSVSSTFSDFDTPVITRKNARALTAPSDANLHERCNRLRFESTDFGLSKEYTELDVRRAISLPKECCAKNNRQLAEDRAEVLARYSHRYDRWLR
mmetsp:Transcript_137506/g.383507  ORF Transcript_137506/g.383507 Transcript_137506/m.383507 type:complete len:112 (-) Transcript_137506:46-381(-)|eukprot:CAMPEP_0179110298 /NCGR_PEP_ID=MMETSP0796-20121207/51470_1 /TAXON_ID=73915 /ORGANISM="Pyrodinium bahamense, Strain pbaha01" /LENGTH=111 /DNA_ID=CAMNT_0020808429 /DNA_START=63 /DNA_END=398 /DNA_ORIENTATION=+